MKIISLDKKSFVEIKLIVIDNNKRLPSIVISVTIQQDGFIGSISEVWIEWNKVKNFLEVTKNIAYKTSLTTCLVSMSPDEMELYFEKDNFENVILKYKLSKWVYVGQVSQLLTLSGGGFEINLSNLDALRDFLLQIEHEFN